MPAFSDTILLIGALAIFVERIVETLMKFWPDQTGFVGAIKQLVAIGAAAGLGFAVVLFLDLHLMKAVIPDAGLTSDQDLVMTALLIGGGSAPAHEVLRYIEEKKKKASNEKEEKENAVAIQRADMKSKGIT